MTDVEFWGLVVNGASAVATMGAVGVSLWLSLRKTPSFAIHDIQVNGMRTLGKDFTTVEKEEYDLLVKVENFLDAQMQVFKIGLRHTLDGGNTGLQGMSTVYPQTNIFIPSRSQYFIKIPLSRDWDYQSCVKAQKIECEISTSFGDRAVDFPKNWIPQLSAAIEKKEVTS